MSNEKTNLPSTPNDAADNILRAVTTGRVPILRFRKGAYYIGDDEVPGGKEFIAYAGDWRRGWRKWANDEVVEDRVVRVADDHREPAERDELDDNNRGAWPVVDGEKRDPWCLENQLPVEDVETGERFLFVTTSVGGKVAIEKICSRYATNIRKGLKWGLPVIKLAVGSFNTKRYGKISRPDFPIVGWENDAGVLDMTPASDNRLNDEIPF
jgi:hypothetical protein